MSDEESAPAEAPAGPPAPKVPKVVLGLLAANLALSAGTLAKTILAPAGGHAPAAAGEHAPKPAERQLTGPLVSLEPFVVNLDEAGTPRYLKIQLQAEVADGGAAKAFEKNKMLIQDEALAYLSSLQVADTLGSENKDRIRGELSERIGHVLGDDRVKRVVFTEFVVQ